MHEFNFETGIWSLVPAAGTVPPPRIRSSLVVFKDSCILFGGYNSSSNLNSVHMFNFAQRTWSTLVTKGSAPTPRSNNIAVVYSNAMYVFGGYSGTYVKDLHKLTLTHAESCAWEEITLKGPPVPSNSGHTAAVFKSDLIFFGGYGDSGDLNDFTQLRLGEDPTCPKSAIPDSTIISELRSLVNNEMMSDVTFVVEDTPIYAHKNLCMLRCDFFKSMFTGEMRESREREFVIHEVRHPIFLLFLEFVYTDDIGDVSVEDAMELFALADRYGVKRLQCICESHLLLALSVDNAATILFAADLHNATALREQCVSFILNNFKTVSKTTVFAEMSCKKVELTLELLQAL